MGTLRFSHRLAASTMLAGVLSPLPAFAQSTDAASVDMVGAGASSSPGEIIVTAQKRSERLQDVPISITAATGDQLARQGITRPEDLGKITPGFSYQKAAYGTPIIAIRGIGVFDYSAGISPTVSVYVDQIPVPYLAMSAGAGFDVERVEVLKGPQGTLFGQNSTGGAINYIARKPTHDWQGGFDLTYGRFNQVDGQVYAGGPLAETLRVRVAARHEYRDPWQISQTRPDDRLGKRDFSQGRVMLDWDASERLTFEMSATGWKDDSDTQAYQFRQFNARVPGGYASGYNIENFPVPPKDPRLADWDPTKSYRNHARYYQFANRADFEASDSLTFSSITAYSHFKNANRTTGTGTNPINQDNVAVVDIRTFSQELRAALDLRGGVKILAGVNYENDRTYDSLGSVDSVATNLGVGPYQFQVFDFFADQHVKTYAAFANVDVPLTQTLTVQAGARYTKQDRDFAGCLRDGGDGALAQAVGLINPALPVAANGACVTYVVTQTPAGPVLSRPDIITGSLHEDNVSWRASLNWKPSRDLLVYGNVTKGYKAGAFLPQPAVFATQLTPVTQESVLAVEIGTKASLLDHAVTLSAAAFYYDYRNKQIQGFLPLPPFGAVAAEVNIPKSRVAGAEAQVDIQPVRGLQLSVGGSYVNSKVKRAPDGIAQDPLGNSIDLTGEQFPNAPRWQLAGTAHYEFAISPTLDGFLGGDASYRSTTNSTFGNVRLLEIPSYTLVGVNFGLKSHDDRWKVQFWGRNIFNKYYTTGPLYSGDAISQLTGEPATYGVTLSTRM